jgi:hypothetical protein
MAFALEMAQKAARVEALEAEVGALKSREVALNEHLDRLNDILKIFNRGRFSRKSETLQAPPAEDDEQLVLLFEEVATGVGALNLKPQSGEFYFARSGAFYSAIDSRRDVARACRRALRSSLNPRSPKSTRASKRCVSVKTAASAWTWYL